MNEQRNRWHKIGEIDVEAGRQQNWPARAVEVFVDDGPAEVIKLQIVLTDEGTSRAIILNMHEGLTLIGMIAEACDDIR